MLVAIYSDNQYIVDDDKDSLGINARFIDGRIRNKKYCAGYCNSDSHPGYLTDEMICQHQCGEKECHTFCCSVDFEKEVKRSKIKESKRFEQQARREKDNVMQLCCSIASRYDGVGVAEVSKERSDAWIVKYASICSFDLAAFKRDVEKALNQGVMLVDGEYDFDRAQRLVYGI